MLLDRAVVGGLVRRFEPVNYLRTTPLAYRTTPLGMGLRKTRFASPTDRFTLLYIAQDLATSIAEAVLRDRFEGSTTREITLGEITAYGATSVTATAPLRLLDLRGNGCFLLGVSTDIVGAKAQDEARSFSEAVYAQTDLDGILYASRLTRKACIAIYDRAVASKLQASAVVGLPMLADLVPSLVRLGVDLIT